ncbi:glycosyltransferase family 1 protein [Natrarchaeobius halalkaliphilus]|uniref:Glycosyltransferase family 1 protein n=1 Tax=Natrarchaeobius halalkaliphilus TaxID=1679091 RepID=A0A3N6MCQ3_9EURY|nr:glycosyltransferase family 4 protein [Natrarchaeobius halalkaliphilus]RQG91526.1 glycosyltransferase family 1 protein [Natrarchaeobius halalkaliphilus]
MNILMTIWGDYPPDARVRKQAKTLLNAGHNVRILCESDSPGIENIKGATVHRVYRPDPGHNLRDVPRSIELLLKNVDPLWRDEVQNEIKKNVDIIHVHDLPQARTVLQESNVPVILDLHENYRKAIYHYRPDLNFWKILTNPKILARRVCKPPWRYHWEQKFAMKNADHVLAVVPEARDEYIRSGIDPEAVSVVSNTVDLEWFDRHIPNSDDLYSEEFTLTYVGSVSGPHRGLDTVIRAIPRIKKEIPNVLFRIAGGGQLNDLEDLANNLGIRDHIEFTGWIDETEFPKYMSSANIGLLPHRSNGHTNTTIAHKLFQYMAAELPVIVTDTRAVGRVVREASAGVVVPPEEPNAIADAAINIFQSEVGRIYGKNGRNAVESKYNWSHDSKQLLKVYDKLC